MAEEYLRARGLDEVAALVARGRAEVVSRTEPWQVAGRTVSAVQVALWLPAADRGHLHLQPRWVELLAEAFGAVVETPDTLLGELLLLVERSAAAAAPVPKTGGYRDAPVAAGRPAGEVLAATAAAVLDAEGATALADALRRARVALEPLPGVPASNVTVALDPADLAAIRRDPRARALVSEALEVAGRTPGHRTADVTFTVRAPAEARGATGERGAAEVALTAAARGASWAVVPLARDAEATTLVLARDAEVVLVRLDARPGAGVRQDAASVRRLTVSEEELGDEAGVLQVVARLGAG